MNFVLFNKGDNKEYFYDCISQIHKHNLCKIYFLGTDDKFLPKYVQFINIDTLKDEKILIFENLKYYENHENPLWNTSTLRFFYIESFIKKYKLENIFHFDNDVLLYDSLEKTLECCLENSDKCWITPCSEAMVVCGMMFIPNFIELSKITNCLLEKISLGINTLNMQYMHRASDFMVNEMTLLKIIGDEKSLFSYFPIMPYGEFSENYNKFNICYDPASWGQYVGGTPNGHLPGWAGKHHSIGRKILDGTFIAIKENEKPIIIDNLGNKFSIINLHIHSKKLKNFI